MSELIFSFGTLQLPAVQRSLFGRELTATPDAIAGWTVGVTTIVDPQVIATSGTDQHPALLYTGDPADLVDGVVLDVTSDELAASDHYERVSYARVTATLVSGLTAWIYVPRAEHDSHN